MTPADDHFPALLGYGDNGTFDIERISPAFKSFLEDYAREMEYAVKYANLSSQSTTDVSPSWEPIAPLLKTKWDQDVPYNNLCPIMEIIDSSGNVTGQTLTTASGCVATSMAQLMKYHEWPDVGVGSNSYEWNGGFQDVLKKKLSYDFSAKPFDWKNMLDTYTTNQMGTRNYTNAQALAVAELMYACGISVNMNYCADVAGGSGAIAQDQNAALINNFKYSRAMRFKYRDYCSSHEFEEIIYDNLKRGLPVLYSGVGSAGGHSFVCDGYAGDHYFHFNWGWSGVSDGYFYLCRLNPDNLGIGGGAGGFNTNQGITYDIIPVKDGIDTGKEEPPYIQCTGNFDFYNQVKSTGTDGKQYLYSYFTVTSSPYHTAGFWNMGTTPFTGSIGVVVETPSKKIWFVPGISADSLEYGRGVQRIPAYLEELTEVGNYRISPAYMDDKNNRSGYIAVVNGCRDHVTMTVNADGSRTFTNQTPEESLAEAPELGVKCFNYNGKIYSNVAHTYLVALANYSTDKDYYGQLHMVLKDSRGRELSSKPLGRYEVPAGMTIPLTFSLNLDLTVKDYFVSFRDSYDRELTGEFPLTIGAKGQALTTQLRVMSFTPTDIKPKTTISQVVFQTGNYGSTAVAAPKFSISFIKEGNTNPDKAFTFSYPSLTLQSGQAINLAVNGITANLDAGIYNVQIHWYKTATETELISQPIVMTVGYPVESVTLSNNNQEINTGQTLSLKATLTPQNATFGSLTWTSSNPEVATVDNTGVVTGISAGQVYITAMAHNGAFDNCVLKVNSSSGIEDIDLNQEDIIEVCDINGLSILQKPSISEINKLSKGVYIIKTSKTTKKIVI